jgi:hypothetical protein
VKLEFKLRALSLLGKSSATWTTPPFLFSISYFSGRLSRYCLGLALNCDPSTYGLSHSWDFSHVLPYLDLLVAMRGSLTNFLPQLALNCHPLDLCLPRSWNYRCEPLCSALKTVYYYYSWIYSFN